MTHKESDVAGAAMTQRVLVGVFSGCGRFLDSDDEAGRPRGMTVSVEDGKRSERA